MLLSNVRKSSHTMKVKLKARILSKYISEVILGNRLLILKSLSVYSYFMALTFTTG